MMVMTGGDAPALFAFANELRRRRSNIQNTVNRLGQVVAEANWVGPDRDAFVSQWQGNHLPTLHAVLDELQQAAGSAAKHAAAQQEASS
jgi:uncharacterized protein YukE